MNGPIRRLTYGLFGAFGLLVLATVLIQGVRADDLKNSPANPRVILSLTGKERGAIVSADGTLLAVSDLVEGTDRRFARRYPEGSLFAWPVGHTTALFGESGLESSWSRELRTRQDLTISDLLTAILGGELGPRSLVLSLDARLQEVAVDALGERAGAIVALDPRTGAVLAWVSQPGYDPQRFVDDPTHARTVVEDPDQPLLDRGGRVLAAPASTFKLVVAAAALESGEWRVEDSLPDQAQLQLPGSTATLGNADGRTCTGGATVSIFEAMVRSCNVPFASLAIELGSNRLVAMSRAFGWEEALDLDLPTERSRFPDPGSDLAVLAQSAIGERDVRTTALQMASVVATIANGGERMLPYLVASTYDAGGDPVAETSPTSLGRVISPATATDLTRMMVEVVRRGTATAAAIPGVQVAGKTGTSVTGPVWFTGFAPADEPTIAVAVVVFDAGAGASGGRTAAPIARAILTEWISP